VRRGPRRRLIFTGLGISEELLSPKLVLELLLSTSLNAGQDDLEKEHATSHTG